MNDGLRLYLSHFKNGTSPVFKFCEYLNISVCPPTETNNVSSAVQMIASMLLVALMPCRKMRARHRFSVPINQDRTPEPYFNPGVSLGLRCAD